MHKIIYIKKIKWINSDIQKNEKISADNESDERKIVGNAVLNYYAYSNKTKKGY